MFSFSWAHESSWAQSVAEYGCQCKLIGILGSSDSENTVHMLFRRRYEIIKTSHSYPMHVDLCHQGHDPIIILVAMLKFKTCS